LIEGEEIMKKLMGLTLTMILAVMLAGCVADTTTQNVTSTTITTTGSNTTTQTTIDATESTTATESHDPVTITYAAWNLGSVDNLNLERLMLDAFEDRYPWITVEVVERPKVPDTTGTSEVDQNWNEFLAARATRGMLPDVYFTDSTETIIMNNWARNMADIAYDDPEFMNISADIREAANYGGKLMALPYAVYYFGYYINKDIFDLANSDAPVFDDTFAEFLLKIQDVANHNVSNGTGTGGVVGIDRMLEWYPSQLSDDLGWFTYDGNQVHLDGAEFEATLDLYQDLMTETGYIVDAMAPEDQLAAFGTSNTWEASQLAAFWNYTPIIGSMTEYDFDVDFIGTPGTADTHKIPVVLDLMGISSQTDHPEEAYLLAKWMSFGKEGYQKRIEFSTSDDYEDLDPLNMTPLQPDKDLLDAFFGIYDTFVELRKVVEYDDYIIEPNKYVPGYIKARWTRPYNVALVMDDVFNYVRDGSLNYAEIKVQWNQFANEELTNAKAAVLAKLGVSEE